MKNNDRFAASVRRKDRGLLQASMAAIIAAGLLAFAAAPAQAQKVVSIGGAKRTVMVGVNIGKTEDVRTDTSFVDLQVGDPEIADVNPLTDKSLSILGRKNGTTRVTAYGENKKLIGVFDVEVSHDTSMLASTLSKRFPYAKLKVASVNGRIMLSGTSPDAVTLDKAVTIARQFGPDVINSVQVLQPQQVMLEVRFIEANREAGRELGVQWNTFSQSGRFLGNVGNRLDSNNLPWTPAGNNTFKNPGVQSGGKNDDNVLRSALVSAGVLSGTAPFGFLVGRLIAGGLSADILVNALEQKGMARSLAEPNLVALSGDTASFLAGGEFPIPVPGSLGTVGIEYKRYGVGPRLHADGSQRRPDQREDRAGSQPARYLESRSGRRHFGAAADRPPRLDHGRIARRPELRDRRAAAKPGPDRAAAAAVARRYSDPRRAVLVEILSEERDRPRHHRDAAARAAGTSGRQHPHAA